MRRKVSMGESQRGLHEAQQVAGNQTVPTQARERERDRERARTMVMAGVMDGAAKDGRGEIMPDQILGEPPENRSSGAFSWGQWRPMEFMTRLRFWKGNSVWGWEWL